MTAVLPPPNVIFVSLLLQSPHFSSWYNTSKIKFSKKAYQIVTPTLALGIKGA